MSFSGITAESILGTEDTGVQSMFPRFQFDLTSRPSFAQVTAYATTAINRWERRCRQKGYRPEALTDPIDLGFIKEVVALEVAAEIHATLDAGKDKATTNVRKERFDEMLRQFESEQTPFLAQRQENSGAETGEYADRIVRGGGRSIYEQPLAERLHWQYDETPTGAVNGSNVTFGLLRIPYPVASLTLIQNGLVLSGFSVTGTVITFAVAPASGNPIIAKSYTWQGA